MAAARRGTLTPEEAAEAFDLPDADSMAEVDARVQAWVRQRMQTSPPPAVGASPHAGPLLWFLLWANPAQSALVVALAFLFIAFRILENMFFTQLMVVLSGNLADLVWGTTLPSAPLSVVLFALCTILSTTFNYAMDT